jgi:hypothetical protein
MAKSDPFEIIKAVFDRQFEAWEIALPEESQAELPRRSIM